MDDDDDDLQVVDNPIERRYELRLDGRIAGSIAYRRRPRAVALIHTEIDPEFEGRGYASRLVADALDDIRAHGLEVVPICRFVRAYLRRHPEYADLVAHKRDDG